MTGVGAGARLGQKRFRYVDSRGRPIEDPGSARAHPRPRDSTGVAGRLDLAERRRKAPGDRHRRGRAGASTSTTRLPRGAGAREVRSAPALREVAPDPAFEDATAPRGSVPYERDWACAIAVSLVNHAWFRVGSDRHARASRTYGITTLTKRHVSISGAEIEFCFRTKNAQLVKRTVENVRLARELARGSSRSRTARDSSASSGRASRSNLTARDAQRVHRRAPRATASRRRTSAPGAARCSRPSSSRRHGPAASESRGEARAGDGHDEGRRRAREHARP